jgi:hypothetical protein
VCIFESRSSSPLAEVIYIKENFKLHPDITYLVIMKDLGQSFTFIFELFQTGEVSLKCSHELLIVSEFFIKLFDALNELVELSKEFRVLP